MNHGAGFSDDSALQRRIQGYLRSVTVRGRDTQCIRPFLATFSRSSANQFLNYAIPDDGAVPTTSDVEGLIRAYERRGLQPRLEYITTLAPEVEPMLLDAGFVIEGRLALMACRPSNERILPAPTGIELIQPQTDRELLDVRTVQHEAYGEAERPNTSDVQRLSANLAARGMAVLARASDSGESAGAGEYTPPLDGLTEITSIAVRAPFRRRGIAAAITGWLVRSAFDAGADAPFLMANETEVRIYARAGFRTMSEILHISR